MAETCGERSYQFKALTELWTGDADGESDRLITTGLLGSIRWWFEVLVRGLGGGACDPTQETKCEGQTHCVVCELFGCTGWARKFRLEVLDENGNIREARDNTGTKISPQIRGGKKFTLRFVPLRPIRDEEWVLLEATLRLISKYGAIGGKTVLKPTDESERAGKPHHKDYGLVKMLEPLPSTKKSPGDIKNYLSRWRKPEHGDFEWASLKHFWCVQGKYLGRVNSAKSTFNQVLGRSEAKQEQERQRSVDQNDKISKWLAGSQQESKKVFSFKNPPRTFGFINPALKDSKSNQFNFERMKERLEKVWGQSGWDFLTGDKLIGQLFSEEDC